MGVVFAATHLRLEQAVAIKFLVTKGGMEAQMRERFEREARAASRMHGEHVARVLDAGVLESGIPYTVMELLEGEDLAKTLSRHGAIPVAEAVGCVLQACEALAEAHAAGIVHRDVKPSNIFLARRADGSVTVKLLDFGISKLPRHGESGAITNETTMLGSPRYMPPEQIRAAHDVDVRSDLWSLGATLFELLTGHPAFSADSLPELCARILEGPPPDLESEVSGAPPGLGAAIRRCLKKRPGDRYASIAELAAAIAPFGPLGASLSVERATRILSVAPPEAREAPAAPPAADVQQLQDAATLKRDLDSDGSPTPVARQTSSTIMSDLPADSIIASSAGARPSARAGTSSAAVLVSSIFVGLLVVTTATVALVRGHAFAAAQSPELATPASTSLGERPSAESAPPSPPAAPATPLGGSAASSGADRPGRPTPAASLSPPATTSHPAATSRASAPPTAASADAAPASASADGTWPVVTPSPLRENTSARSAPAGAAAPLNTAGFGDRR
jgi:serine/threonine-protein kinase